MQAGPAAPPKDQLFLTTLPNGRKGSGGVLRLSVLLTPSLGDNTHIPAPFDKWPDYAGNLKWIASFFRPDHSLISSAISAGITPTIDPLSSPEVNTKLWQEIFVSVDKVARRKATNHVHKSWRLSHNITHLHKRHQLARLAYAYNQLCSLLKIAVPAGFADVPDQIGAPELFLHPEFGPSSHLAEEFDDRKTVSSRFAALLAALPTTTTNYPSVVQPRVDYAVKKLETYGGAKLSAVSLSSVYISCLKSAAPLTQPDPQVDAAIATIKGWFTSAGLQPDYPDINVVIHYIQMLLFHRRSPVKKLDDVPKPDFHQMLGLVHNHPAIMRKLGLVLDFVVTPPSVLSGPCSVIVQLDTRDALTQQIANTLTVSSVYTQCTIADDDFFANPKSPAEDLFHNGLLNLQAPSTTQPGPGSTRFTLVPENADGQALKRTDQANNRARSAEYTTSAPTAMRSTSASLRTASLQTNPVSVPPAPRTVGLALFDQDRLAKLEQSASNVPPPTTANPTPQPPSDFFADDLILGYRVDVLYKQKFFSLCLRDSIYEIYPPYNPNPQKIDSWKPSTPMELSADEGFVSFAATQSPLTDGGTTDDPSTTQMQVHQALFTWTGWSLAVPQPGLPVMNPQTPQDPTNSLHSPLRPKYSLPANVKLPPLRFNTDYRIRCRIVDLAGNGVPADLDPYNLKFAKYTAAPIAQFSRHEPLRAPQFLLLKPIDRDGEPGTHVDRLVARDNDKRSARMLVPPRESLRLAELSGFLSTDELPSTAFEHQQLLADGSFPSVACAKYKQWVDGEVNEPADNDGIFLSRITDDPPENPYYSDPLANFIRVEAIELTDNPDQSVPVDLRWIKISSDASWPKRLPARVRLVPKDAGADPKIEVDAHATVEEHIGYSSVPTFDVNLPKASTVLLRISTAAVEGSEPTADQMQYPVHLFHLTQSHIVQLQTAQQGSLTALASATNAAMIDAVGGTLAASHLVDTPHVFVNGSLDVNSPKRTMTLVHAVKQPLEPPAFAPEGSPGVLQVLRDPGKSEAKVSGELRAHWLSTGKITCYAEWADKVDDLTRSGPVTVRHREVAFAITSKELVSDTPFPTTRLRLLKRNTVLEHFLDTRAHDVTYSLVAATSFREYYAPAAPNNPNPDESEFQREGTKPVKLTVVSSVRPLAPVVTYLIPAYVWTDTYDPKTKTWYSGRTVVVRVYLERPFLLSGDRETLGVVLFDSSSGVAPGDQLFVSRWGADPTRQITTPILQNELSEANLCEPGAAIETCTLAEGGSARIKPCKLQYCKHRKLWYSDIPINTQHANAPFVRLALVRWQPDALQGTGEARCSQVVVAEFLQLSPDRWLSVQKHRGSHFTIAISGPFPSNPPTPCFEVTLYKRWYALGRDTGWRKVDCSVKFDYHPATDDTGVSTWSGELHTKESAYWAKYRVLLTEQEFPGDSRRHSFSTFINLP